jgi:hypothetical protein
VWSFVAKEWNKIGQKTNVDHDMKSLNIEIVRFNKFKTDAEIIINKLKKIPYIELVPGKDSRERIFVLIEGVKIATVSEKQIEEIKSFIPCSLRIDNVSRLKPTIYSKKEKKERFIKYLTLECTLMN